MREITGVLLAAGSSRRFGNHKLLHEIQGKPLILRSAGCLEACHRLLAIVRADDLPLQQCLQQAGIETVINPLAHQGMGRSLACGIAASPHSDGWCILPADMPYISPHTGRRIVRALMQGAAITAPYFKGRRGHPVGFNRTYREQLLALQGDTGARTILADTPQAIVEIPVEDPGILWDIDTPQDLS
jgi:molybdenum cofactor cytidylyltransferase